MPDHPVTAYHMSDVLPELAEDEGAFRVRHEQVPAVAGNNPALPRSLFPPLTRRFFPSGEVTAAFLVDMLDALLLTLCKPTLCYLKLPLFKFHNRKQNMVSIP
jgi:hypothetical protein